MWKRRFFIFVMSMSTALTLQAQENKRSEAERLVREVVNKLADTLGSDRAQVRSSLFADDALIINAFGDKREGRKEIDKFWEEIFSSQMFRTSQNKEKEISVRFLTPELALVDRFYVLTGQRGPNSGRELPPREIHMTLILRKEKKHWLIIYYSVADLRSLPAQNATPQKQQR